MRISVFQKRKMTHTHSVVTLCVWLALCALPMVSGIFLIAPLEAEISFADEDDDRDDRNKDERDEKERDKRRERPRVIPSPSPRPSPTAEPRPAVSETPLSIPASNIFDESQKPERSSAVPEPTVSPQGRINAAVRDEEDFSALGFQKLSALTGDIYSSTALDSRLNRFLKIGAVMAAIVGICVLVRGKRKSP